MIKKEMYAQAVTSINYLYQKTFKLLLPEVNKIRLNKMIVVVEVRKLKSDQGYWFVTKELMFQN